MLYTSLYISTTLAASRNSSLSSSAPHVAEYHWSKPEPASSTEAPSPLVPHEGYVYPESLTFPEYVNFQRVFNAGFSKTPQTVWAETTYFMWAQLFNPTPPNERTIPFIGLPSLQWTPTQGAFLFGQEVGCRWMLHHNSSHVMLQITSDLQGEKPIQLGLYVMSGNFGLTYPKLASGEKTTLFNTYHLKGLKERELIWIPDLATSSEFQKKVDEYISQDVGGLVALQSLISHSPRKNFSGLKMFLEELRFAFMPFVAQLTTEQLEKAFCIAGCTNLEIAHRVKMNSSLQEKQDFVKKILGQLLGSIDPKEQAFAVDTGQMCGLIPYYQNGGLVLLNAQEIKETIATDKSALDGFYPFCEMIIGNAILKCSLLDTFKPVISPEPCRTSDLALAGPPCATKTISADPLNPIEADALHTIEAPEDLDRGVSLAMLSVIRGIVAGDESIMPSALQELIDDAFRQQCITMPKLATAKLWNYITCGKLWPIK